MPKQQRLLALVALVILAGGYYVYANPNLIPFFGGSAKAAPGLSSQKLVDNSASLTLDEPTKTAIRKYFNGITVEPKENDLNHAIQLDHGVGRPQMSRGETRAALNTYQKILAISYLQGSLMGVGIALNSLATVIDQTGDKDGALYATFLAYKVAKALDNKEEIGVVELSFARRLWNEDKDVALPWLLRARESLKTSRYKTDYVRLLPDIAEGLRLLHENEQASALHEEAWNLSHTLGKSHDQTLAVRETGLHYAADLSRRKQYGRAKEVLEKTQTAFAPNEKLSPTYQSLLQNLAHNYTRLNDVTAARDLYLTAYTYYDLARMNTPGEDGRLWLDEEKKELIDDIVNHFVQSNEIATALTVLESNKASTLSDIIDDPAFRQAQAKWKEMELRQSLELLKLLDGDTSPRLSLGQKVLVVIDELVRKHRQEAQQLQSELKLKNVTVARRLSADKLRAIQSSLPANVAVVSFFVQHKGSSVFLVTRNGIRHVPVNLTGCECMKAAQQLRLALSNPNTDFYREPAQFLYKTLLGSALKTLPSSVNTIVYSPDGPLARVPLAALMDGERFIGEQYAIYAVPSLRFLETPVETGKTPEQHGLACVDPEIADGRLPAQSEAGEVLQKLYGDKIVTLAAKACSSKALVSEIQKRKTPLFIHLGAPAFLHPPKRMGAAVLLSPDPQSKQKATAWSASEIAAIDMSHVALVTLSTTAPGLVEYKYQRDAIGIIRPLFFAGARRVLAPLWYTADEPAGEFMKAFYRSYAKNISAAVSLQQAQLALMRSEKYRHPHYWATYMLTEGL